MCGYVPVPGSSALCHGSGILGRPKEVRIKLAPREMFLQARHLSLSPQKLSHLVSDRGGEAPLHRHLPAPRLLCLCSAVHPGSPVLGGRAGCPSRTASSGSRQYGDSHDLQPHPGVLKEIGCPGVGGGRCEAWEAPGHRWGQVWEMVTKHGDSSGGCVHLKERLSGPLFRHGGQRAADSREPDPPAVAVGTFPTGPHGPGADPDVGAPG